MKEFYQNWIIKYYLNERMPQGCSLISVVHSTISKPIKHGDVIVCQNNLKAGNIFKTPNQMLPVSIRD